MYTNRLKKKRWVLIALVLTVALFATYVPPVGNETVTALNYDVAWSSNPAFSDYYKNVAGLPDIFSKHEGAVNLYYMVTNYDAVYCTERGKDIADQDQIDNTDPNITLTPEQRSRTEYLLKYGATKYEPGNTESNKLQAATQLAIWLVLEGYDNDETVKDLVLYKESGSVRAGDAFAPTPEIGRLARKLLGDAQNRVVRKVPSFLAETEADAKVMQLNANEVYLEDENKSLGLDWNGGLLAVKEDEKAEISVDQDTMHVYGLTKDKTYNLVFNYYVNGEIIYMTPENGDTYQKMVRYIKLEDKATLLYLKLRYSSWDTPPVDPPVTTPPPITTPPPVTTPPPIDPPVTTPPPITTPPPVTTPPPIDPPTRPPTGETTPPPGSGTGRVPPPPEPAKPVEPPKPPEPAKPVEPPKPPEPTNPAEPPKPEVQIPPEPTVPINDDGTPTGNWNWNDGKKEWVFTPKGKLPQTGAVLDTSHMGTLPVLPYGDMGAGALAAFSLGLMFYLRRTRGRD